MAFYCDNAISWAFYRLRGGWKSLLILAAWYSIAAMLFIALPYELALGQRDKMVVLEVASMMALIVQVVMLLLLSGLAVSGGIRRDLMSGLIESHRLMPLSPVQAIVGYIAGAGLQLLSLCIVNLIIGAALFGARGVPVQNWIISNGLLFGFSISVWTAMAMAAFVSRSIIGWLIGLLVSITGSGGFVFVVLPGLLVFCSPMQGRTIFQVTSNLNLSSGTVVALCAQFLMAVLCIRAAARKYADASALSFTMAPSLATLGIWAGLSWFGITDFQELRPRPLSIGSFDWRLLVIGAVASCLLVALLPLGALAWSDILRRQRRMDGEKLSSRPWMLPLCVSISLLFVLAPLTATVDSTIVFRPQYQYFNPTAQRLPVTRQSQVQVARSTLSHYVTSFSRSYAIPVIRGTARPEMIAAVCGIFLLQMYLLMRLLFPVVRRANQLILLIIGLSWFCPLLADVIYYGTRNKDPIMNKFALFSPMGTIIQALDNPIAGTWRGVGAQGAACLSLAVLFILTQFRRAGRRPAPIGLATNL